VSQEKIVRTHSSAARAVATLVIMLGLVWVGVPQAAATGPHPGRDARHPARYVAMGDSYSSGEGTFVYDDATDTSTNRCHRSPLAAGPVLSRVDRHLRPLAFVACSGAQTRDLYAANHTYPTEGAQLVIDAAVQMHALSSRTRTVTLTLGGNDIGFAEVVGGCIATARVPGRRCSENPLLTGTVSLRLAALAGLTSAPGSGLDYQIRALRTVLDDIHQRAPRATIYLAGYPLLFGSRTADFTADLSVPSGYSCSMNTALHAVMDYGDAQYVNAATERLNTVLRGATADAAGRGIDAAFVPAGPFAGHGLCDAKTPWIRPVLLNPDGSVKAESLHTTVRGSLGYAQAYLQAGVAR